MEVSYKPGFTNRPGQFSVYSISIEPGTHKCGIAGEQSNVIYHGDPTQMHELRLLAANAIASDIVGKLHYEKLVPVRPFEPVQHVFSIKDYTILESEVKEQMIIGLQDDLYYANKQYDNLYSYHKRAERDTKYNNRPIWTKCKGWLLYDKPFTKEVTWKS